MTTDTLIDIRDPAHRLHHLWRFRAYRQAGIDRYRARLLTLAALREHAK